MKPIVDIASDQRHQEAIEVTLSVNIKDWDRYFAMPLGAEGRESVLGEIGNALRNHAVDQLRMRRPS